MFDWLLPEKHAIAILKKDHDDVKGLFSDFEKAEAAAAKEKIIGQAVQALKIHAVIEEEIFYPAVRQHVGSKVMNEADEEHHVAKVLIAELDQGSNENHHRDAKFTVLAESVRHHIKEEESEMLPKAKEVEIDFEALGRRMLERKRQLQAKGFPVDAEHAMVASVNGKTDSPAVAARRKKRASSSRKTTGKNAMARKSKTHARH